MARLRKSGNSGGIKFRRALNVEWSTVPLESTESILGSEGDIQRTIVFGDPHSSEAQGPIFIENREFTYYYNDDACDLESSTGRSHKITGGPFFKTTADLPSESIRHLTSLGSWVSNLPAEAHLNMTIDDLVTDNVYQIRCIFLDGKKKTTPGLILGPGNHRLEYNPPTGIVAVGTFIAVGPSIVISIKSTTNMPPHINSVVLRHVDTRPSMVISQLRTISNSKA